MADDSKKQMDLSPTLRNGFSYYFRDFLEKVRIISDDLSDEEFWSNPYPYGNSVGHLVLHITGNLKFYIGTHLASSGYIRDREREFTEPNPPSKADALHQLKLAVDIVVAALEKQKDNDWSLSYSAEGVDDVPDRFSIFLRCAVHFHHHIGHMSYVRDEYIRQRGAGK